MRIYTRAVLSFKGSFSLPSIFVLGLLSLCQSLPVVVLVFVHFFFFSFFHDCSGPMKCTKYIQGIACLICRKRTHWMWFNIYERKKSKKPKKKRTQRELLWKQNRVEMKEWKKYHHSSTHSESANKDATLSYEKFKKYIYIFYLYLWISCLV